MKNSILRTVILKKVSLLDKLLLLVDDYSIYIHFIGKDLELGQPIESPIRSVDDNPSFCLYLPTRIQLARPDEIWFKDQADGRFGNVLTFVKYFALHNFNIELKNHYEIIKFIDSEMNLGLFSNNDNKTKKERVAKEIIKRNTEISYTSRSFTKIDLKYWLNFGITKSTLDHFKVKSVRYLLDENNIIIKEFKTNELAFVYCINDKVKLYRPKEIKQFKFRNNCPGNDPHYYQGFEQLEGHNILLLTKSLKDIMCFYELFKEMNIKCDLIAPQAESVNLDDKFVTAIKERYKRIIIISDFDRAGVMFVQRCRKQYNLLEFKFISTKRISIDNKMKVLDKDVSDYYELNGKEKTKKLIKTWNLI